MTSIVVTSEQAELFKGAPDGIEVRGPTGELIGVFAPIVSDEDIRLAKQALDSNFPRRTTAQVLERLRAMERP